jgi:hypothetical protein
MAAKVCPLCHCSNSGSAWQCRCGYEFGQSVDTVRVLLRDQQTNAWIVLGVLLALDLALVAGSIYADMFGWGWLPWVVPGLLSAAAARMVSKLRIARESLRQLAERHAPLPRATLRRH